MSNAIHTVTVGAVRIQYGRGAGILLNSLCVLMRICQVAPSKIVDATMGLCLVLMVASGVTLVSLPVVIVVDALM